MKSGLRSDHCLCLGSPRTPFRYKAWTESAASIFGKKKSLWPNGNTGAISHINFGTSLPRCAMSHAKNGHFNCLQSEKSKPHSWGRVLRSESRCAAYSHCCVGNWIQDDSRNFLIPNFSLRFPRRTNWWFDECEWNSYHQCQLHLMSLHRWAWRVTPSGLYNYSM
jgi:hypothetical protein